MAAAKRTKHNLITEIVTESRELLLQTIRWLVPTMEDAEDILQDVLYRLWGNIDEIKSLNKTTTWLLIVARNRVIDWYRSRSTSPNIQDHEGGEDRLLLEEFLPDMTDNPESRHEQLEMGMAIDEALSTLPPKQRDVFVWHEIEGRSFAEIAGRTGTPVNTLLSQKRYAVLELRTQLQHLRTLE